MCNKMAISAYILEIVEKGPFLRLRMRAKEDDHHKHLFLAARESLILGYRRLI